MEVFSFISFPGIVLLFALSSLLALPSMSHQLDYTGK